MAPRAAVWWLAGTDNCMHWLRDIWEGIPRSELFGKYERVLPGRASSDGRFRAVVLSHCCSTDGDAFDMCSLTGRCYTQAAGRGRPVNFRPYQVTARPTQVPSAGGDDGDQPRVSRPLDQVEVGGGD